MNSYKELDIYQTGLELFFVTHALTLKLPKYEWYELGSQLRRSSDSIISNIVEGYGRRKYKREFVKFLTYSHASCLETLNHIEKLKNLYPEFTKEYQDLYQKYDILGAKIYTFIQYVENNWRT